MEKTAGDGILLLNEIASPGFKMKGVPMTRALKKALFEKWFR
jgi:hypothetical protein